MKNGRQMMKKSKRSSSLFAGFLAFVLLFSAVSVGGYAAEQTAGLAEVYVNGEAGDDTRSGENAQAAVRSLGRARELMAAGGKVVVTGTVTIAAESQISWLNIKVDESFAGPAIHVTAGGALALDGVYFESSGQPLVLNSGVVTLSESMSRDVVVLSEGGRVVAAPVETEAEVVEETEAPEPETEPETAVETEAVPETETEPETEVEETETAETEPAETEKAEDEKKSDSAKEDKQAETETEEVKEVETEAETEKETQKKENDKKSSSKNKKEEVETEETEEVPETEAASDAAQEVINLIVALPQEVTSMADLARVVEAHRSYEALSRTEKKEIARETVKSLEAAKELAGAYNKVSNGVTVQGESLTWNIQLRATRKADSDNIGKADVEELILPYELKLWDILTDKEYQPEEQVYITMPVPDLDKYEDVVVVHYLADGTIEYIRPAIEDGVIGFYTSSFSAFDVAGSSVLAGGGGRSKSKTSNDTSSKTDTVSSGSVAGSSSLGGGSSAQNSNTSSSSTKVTNYTPKTFDESAKAMLVFGLVSAAALIVIVVMIVSKKRKKDSDDE